MASAMDDACRSEEEKIKFNLSTLSEIIINRVDYQHLMASLPCDILSFVQTKEIQNIRQKDGPAAATKRILRMVEESKRSGKYQALVDALKKDYPILSKALTGHPLPDDSIQQNMIKVFSSYITERVSTMHLLPYLIRSNVIGQLEKEMVEAEFKNYGNIRAAQLMLLKLPDHVENWYTEFLKALCDSDQKDLANFIDESFTIKYIACLHSEVMKTDACAQLYRKVDTPDMDLSEDEHPNKVRIKELKEENKTERKEISLENPAYGGSESTSLSTSKSDSSTYRIKVVKGEMAHQQADVLVNTTSNNLNLSQGAVSASLLAAGGQQLQDECTKKYPNGIKPGEFAITGPGELRSVCVFHGCLPEWAEDGSNISILKTFMSNCLSEAGVRSLESIAFPALGTGTLKYPKDLVAKEMFSCVSDFLKKNADASLVDVRFVIYEKDLETFKTFEDEQKKFLKLLSPTKQDVNSGYLTKQRQGRQAVSESLTSSENPQSGEIRVPQVKIIHGNITTCTAEAIVNPTDKVLCLDGSVSRAILKQAGTELKQECAKHEKKMKDKGIIVTPGFKLQAKFIFHINVRDQQHGWKGIILKCLKQAVKRKLQSIAFPALGTGIVGGNPEEIGKALFEATCEIIQAGNSNLKEIQMVIFQSEMISKIQLGVKAAQESMPKTSTWWESFKGFFGFGKEMPSVQVLRADGKKVIIHICADSETAILNAIDGIEGKYNKEMDADVVTDDAIKRMSEKKMSEIESIGRKYNAAVKVEKRIGRVRIEGLQTDIGKVKTDVLNLIRVFEKMENMEKQAQLLSQLVQWYYIEITSDGQNLNEYNKDINVMIEEAYQKKEKCLKLRTDSGSIIIDLDALEEYPEADPNDKMKVLRKDKIKDSVSEIPPQWDPMDKDNLRLIPLQSTSKEYTDVATRFMATVKKENATAIVPVAKIERIQNRTLYAQYQSKKKLIDEMNPGQTNEMDLWHGTAGHAVDSINVHGFNRSFCGKNATKYGEGVYFGKESYYSARDLYSPPDPAGNKRMYLTKVLTGKYDLGKEGMRVPPPLVIGQPEMYDSVVDNVNTPFIFVIFHDTQAYPEYLITFKWN